MIDTYVPFIVWAAFWIILLPVRLTILLLLPINAQYKWHPLRRLYNLVKFG